MSVSGRAEEEPASEEAPAPVRDMYEQKSVSKVVRVLTVLAYLFSVSFAAILLSIYYICVWKSPELPMRDAADDGAMSGLSARRADHPYHFKYSGDSYIIHKLAGGSDTTVKESVTQPMPVVTSSLPTPISVTELPSTTLSLEDVATDYTTEAANDTSGGDVYNVTNIP